MPLYNEATRLAILLKQFSRTDYTPPTSYSIAAVTTSPSTADGTGLGEPTSYSYSRLVVPNNATEFGLSSAGSEIVNLKQWTFTSAYGEAWGTILGIALFDNTGVFMGYLPFNTPKYIGLDHTLQITEGSFIITSDATPLSVYIEEKNVPSILTSPNGTKYAMSVSNAGAIVLTSTAAFGPPAAPTALANTSGTLSWVIPTNDGGTPIISQTLWKFDSDSLLVNFEILDGITNTYVLPVVGAAGVYSVTAENSAYVSSYSNFITVT